MSKNLKKILVTGASLLIFASVGAGFNGVHASHVTESQDGTGVNRLIPGARRSNGYVVDRNFHKHGYLFNVYTELEQARDNVVHGSTDPIIVGINGDKHVSNAQVWAALRGHRIHLHRHHRRYHHKRHVVRRRRNHRNHRRTIRYHVKRNHHRRVEHYSNKHYPILK